MSALSACAGSESHFSSLRSRQRRTEPLPEAMRGTDTKRLPKRHLTYRLERIQENKSDKSEERRFRNLTDETNCLWRGEQSPIGPARGSAPPRTPRTGTDTAAPPCPLRTSFAVFLLPTKTTLTHTDH